MKTFNVVTIFPDMFESPFSKGVVAKAVEKGLLKINPINLRDYAATRHQITDDYQYGGGAGLVMKPEPLCEAVKAVKSRGDTHTVLLDPRGSKFDQRRAERLAELESVTFLCGRYEGVDERVRELVVDEELSIGDFILTGGEFAAMVVIDAVARLVPGVLGDESSAEDESFTTGLLEYPHYTRPAEYMGLRVPDVLVNGNHAEIEKWRRARAIEITSDRRPDLLGLAMLSPEERRAKCARERIGKGKKLNLNVALMHYPMKDKKGDTVVTAITNLDLHDISRSCTTYGADAYYVVTPLDAQRDIAGRVIKHWMEGFGAGYNPNRKEAFLRTEIKASLTETLKDAERRYGKKPIIVATTARPDRATVTAAELGVIAETEPVLLLFGTGWGFTDDILDLADYVVEPIEGAGEFNHLSVRSAVAILLDRITRN